MVKKIKNNTYRLLYGWFIAIMKQCERLEGLWFWYRYVTP